MNKVNFLNIGIIVILAVSGVLVSFHDSQIHKEDLAAGVNSISSAMSSAMPANSLQAAMPELTYQNTTNSLAAINGGTLLLIVCLIIFTVTILGMLQGVCGMARC